MKLLMIKDKKGRSESMQGIVIGAILITLFTVLIIGFATDTLNNYGKDTTELEEGAFNLTPSSNYLEDIYNTSNSTLTTFRQGNIFSQIAGIVVTGIFGIGLGMIGLITTPFTLFAQIMTNVLHAPQIFTSVLLGIMLFTIIFAIWRLIKEGS